MNSNQRKLIENFIRKEVRKSLKESLHPKVDKFNDMIIDELDTINDISEKTKFLKDLAYMINKKIQRLQRN